MNAMKTVVLGENGFRKPQNLNAGSTFSLEQSWSEAHAKIRCSCDPDWGLNVLFIFPELAGPLPCGSRSYGRAPQPTVQSPLGAPTLADAARSSPNGAAIADGPAAPALADGEVSTTAEVARSAALEEEPVDLPSGDAAGGAPAAPVEREVVRDAASSLPPPPQGAAPAGPPSEEAADAAGEEAGEGGGEDEELADDADAADDDAEDS